MVPIIPHIVRRMDPMFLSKLLTKHEINTVLKKGILKAVKTYNASVNTASKKYESACNKAADKLESNIKKL